MTDQIQRKNKEDPIHDIMASGNSSLREHLAKASFVPCSINANVAFESRYVYTFKNYHSDMVKLFKKISIYSQATTELLGLLEVQAEGLVKNLKRS